MTDLDKAIETILKECNIMGNEERISNALFDKVTSDHRTIQQVFIKQIHRFLVSYAEANSDGRNEASVEYAKKVRNIEVYFPYV